MTGKTDFDSEALRVNLERTRMASLKLPAEHEWLLRISRDYVGICQRVQTMLMELNHPYSNDNEVVKLIRGIALQDLWFFTSHDDSSKALFILLDIVTGLFNQKLDVQLYDRLFRTLLEFIEDVQSSGTDDRHHPVIARAIEIAEKTLQNNEFTAVHASGYLKKLVSKTAHHPLFGERVAALLKYSLYANLDYWQTTSSIEDWFQNRKGVFNPDHSRRIAALGNDFFSGIRKDLDGIRTWDEMLTVPDFNTIVTLYRTLMDGVPSRLDRIYYVIHLLYVPGMTYITDQLLGDLNRLIRNLQVDCANEELLVFIDRVFSFFIELKSDHMGTVLDCILTLGKEIYATKDQPLINRFIDLLIEFGFVSPRLAGIDEEWQLSVDLNHIKNIRVWLELIKCNPEQSSKLLSALIIHLKISGVFIRDTDLFQRDITGLLNTDIEPVYKLVKQLCRLFPVYFNEIGAEGELRDITTSMDEYTHRQDRMIHFLRKQIHTESNNTHIDMVRKIARYWFDGDPEPLREHLPADVREQLKASGKWYDPVHGAIKAICHELGKSPEDLLETNLDLLTKYSAAVPEKYRKGFPRVIFLVKLLSVLKQKYTLDASGIIPQMKRMSEFTPDEIEGLKTRIESEDLEDLLNYIFILMHKLRGIILDKEPSQGREDIYHKRHIAAGIPSMYGRYIEPKFESLGLTFRMEQLVKTVMDRFIQQINLSYVTARTLKRICLVLELFLKGFQLDGISNEGFYSNLRMLHYSLTTTSFSLDQFVNLFQFMAQNVKEIIQEYFLGYHDANLKAVLTRRSRIQAPELPDVERLKSVYQESEKFYRDIISSAFLVQQMDNFIGSVLGTLRTMTESLTPEVIRSVMNFDLDLIASPIDQPTPEIDNRIFLGAKGYFLKKLYSYGFPIPQGFILTTELFRRKDIISWYPEMDREVNHLILDHLKDLQKKTGRSLGDPSNLLILSVRSGAAFSMPGAMNSFLNVGLNDRIVESLSCQASFRWTSWDCYRRFLQSWGMAYGINRDRFDQIIIDYKRQYKIKEKVQFMPDQMRSIALAYRQLLKDNGIDFEEDPVRQTMQAIRAVMDSWNTERARIYRKRLRIAEEWGTAVIVQQMVLGNLDATSGTGVFFTKDPFVSKPGVSIYGDFTICSQGEDVVAGLVHTLPISEEQRKRSQTSVEISLEKDFPEIYAQLVERSSELINQRGFAHQEIEFTFESDRKGDFHILQTRDHTTRKEDRIPVFKDPDVEKNLIGTGIGVSGGAMNGAVAFDMDDLDFLARVQPGVPRILVRPDTVPDDIGMIFECDGLLTARGGATSHAAVTAAALGKTCVVNCRLLKVREDQKRCYINKMEFKPGDRIAIDGRFGNIFRDHFTIEYVPLNGKREDSV